MSRHRLRRHYEPPVPAALATIARKGAAYSGLAMFLVQAVSLVSTLIIARLLSPAEVGLYAAGTILAGFITVFADGGLQSALVQRQTDVEDAADTAFYATLGTGLVTSTVALLCAPLVGWLFDNPDAATIAAVTSGMLLMHAMTNVPDGLMMRRFNFKRRLIIDPSKAVVYGAVTITFASLGYGVWALVIGNYASMAVWLIGTWVLARWRPGLGYASVKLWREMAKFAYPLVGWSVSSLTRDAVQTALMGRVLGEAALGQYRYGNRLGSIPSQVVVQVGSFVIFPAFSRMSGEPERFRRGFFRALRWIWFASIPLAGLLLALGQPAVVVLLGEQWADAGLLLMALAGVGACAALQEVSGEAMKGAGQSQRLNYLAAVELVVGIALLVLLLPFGLLGVGLSVLGMELAVAVTALALARSVVGFTAGQLVRALAPATVAAAVATAVVAPLEHLVARSAEQGTLIGALQLVGLTILFGLVYLLTIRFTDRSLLDELRSGLRSMLARRRAAGTDDDSDDDDDEDSDDDPGLDGSGADSETEVIETGLGRVDLRKAPDGRAGNGRPGGGQALPALWPGPVETTTPIPRRSPLRPMTTRGHQPMTTPAYRRT